MDCKSYSTLTILQNNAFFKYTDEARILSDHNRPMNFKIFSNLLHLYESNWFKLEGGIKYKKRKINRTLLQNRVEIQGVKLKAKLKSRAKAGVEGY